VLARVLSAALVGVQAALVRVEVDVTPGLPAFTTVGLPDSAVRESRERVRTAIRNAGFAFPSDRITVNLAPADLRKEGTSFDLPIALGILAATGAVTNGRIGPFAVVGELALDGQIQAVRGALAVGLACRRQGIGTLVVPVENHTEAQAVDGLRVLAAPTAAQPPPLRRRRSLPRPGQRTISTLRTSEANCTPSARSRSRPRARTTCCSSVRRVGERRCWRAGWRRSCPR